MITNAISAAAVPGTIPDDGPPGGDLGKQEFLTLLIAQLKNQDPLNPSKPEEFASQLAQFSSLEQLIEVNDSLAAQADTNAAMAHALNNSSALNVLGKTVLAMGDQVDVTGAGDEAITVAVGDGGGYATLKLYDTDGREVGSLDLGTIGGGRQEIELGEAAAGLEPGQYRYELTVTNSASEPVPVQTFVRMVIDGLRYGSQGPTLTSGDVEIPLADVVEIITRTD